MFGDWGWRALPIYSFTISPACASGGGRDRRADDARRVRRRRTGDQRPPHATPVGTHAGDAESKEHGEGLSDPDARLQGGGRARGLEAGRQRALCTPWHLSDLPLVGGTRP